MRHKWRAIKGEMPLRQHLCGGERIDDNGCEIQGITDVRRGDRSVVQPRPYNSVVQLKTRVTASPQ